MKEAGTTDRFCHWFLYGCCGKKKKKKKPFSAVTKLVAKPVSQTQGKEKSLLKKITEEMMEK